MPLGPENFSKQQTIKATVKHLSPRAIDRKKGSASPILSKNKLQDNGNWGNCKNTEALKKYNLTALASRIS